MGDSGSMRDSSVQCAVIFPTANGPVAGGRVPSAGLFTESVAGVTAAAFRHREQITTSAKNPQVFPYKDIYPRKLECQSSYHTGRRGFQCQDDPWLLWSALCL